MIILYYLNGLCFPNPNCQQGYKGQALCSGDWSEHGTTGPPCIHQVVWASRRCNDICIKHQAGHGPVPAAEALLIGAERSGRVETVSRYLASTPYFVSSAECGTGCTPSAARIMSSMSCGGQWKRARHRGMSGEHLNQRARLPALLSSLAASRPGNSQHTGR